MDGVPHVGWQCTTGGWEWETLLDHSRKLKFSATRLLRHQPLSFSFIVYAFSKLTILIFNLKVFVIFSFLWGFFCVYVFHVYFKYCWGHTIKDIAFIFWNIQGYGFIGGHTYWAQTFEERTLLPALSWLSLLPVRSKVHSFMVNIQPLLRSQMTKPAKYELKALNPQTRLSLLPFKLLSYLSERRKSWAIGQVMLFY